MRRSTKRKLRNCFIALIVICFVSCPLAMEYMKTVVAEKILSTVSKEIASWYGYDTENVKIIIPGLMKQDRDKAKKILSKAFNVKNVANGNLNNVVNSLKTHDFEKVADSLENVIPEKEMNELENIFDRYIKLIQNDIEGIGGD